MKTSTKKSLISVAVVLVLVLALTCVLAACGNKPNAPTSDPKAASFVNIDVNPSLELVLDENNMVLDVQAANEDAEILIHGEKGNGIVGNSLDVAVKNIGKLSVEMGYVSEDNNHINISVSSDLDVEAIKASVKTNLEAGVKESASLVGQAAGNLQCVVEDGIDLAYKYELEAIRAKYNLKEEDLDLAKYRLIRSAMLHRFGLTFTEAYGMSNAQLADIIANEKADLKAHVEGISAETIKQLKTAYENSKTVAQDLSYIASLDTNYYQLDEFLYSADYVAAHIYELCMKQSYDIYKVAMYQVKYDEADMREIAKMLYNNDTDAQNAFLNDSKNANGEWTKDSIMQYANKQYRNMDAQARANFDAAYNKATNKINEELNKTHSFDITASINGFTASMSAEYNVPEEAVSAIKDSMGVVKTFVDSIKLPSFDKKSAEEKFENKIEKAEERTANKKAKMLNKLTDEQIQKAQNMQESYKTTIAKYEEAYNNKMAEFNTAAEQWLADAQKARLEQYEANQAK